jgi:hypothetical protein
VAKNCVVLGLSKPLLVISVAVNLPPAVAKKISALPEEEKTLVLKMITAYIRDFNTQQAYAS